MQLLRGLGTCLLFVKIRMRLRLITLALTAIKITQQPILSRGNSPRTLGLSTTDYRIPAWVACSNTTAVATGQLFQFILRKIVSLTNTRARVDQTATAKEVSVGTTTLVSPFFLVAVTPSNLVNGFSGVIDATSVVDQLQW